MRSKHVLDFLESAVLALKLDGITSASIVRPNTLVDIGSQRLYFELFVSDFSVEPETERSTIARCGATIVAAGAFGEGIEQIDAIAQALVDLFTTRQRRGTFGWSVRKRIYGDPTAESISRVYVNSVERTNGTVVDGRYKVKIVVKLEIYEE